MTPFSITETIIKRFANWRTALVLTSFFGLLITACEKDNILGIELQPDGQFDTLSFIDTFSIQAMTKMGQRQRSDESVSYLGNISSSVFGTAQSAFALNFQLIQGNLNLFGDYTVDSVVLHLRPDKIYGDPTEPLAVEVYELSNPIYADSGYYSDYEPTLKGGLIGSSNFSFPRKKVGTKDVISVNGNSEAFQFRIRLDNAVGEILKNALINPSVTSTKTFQQYFAGLFIKPAGNQVLNVGSIYALALLYGESGIRVYASDSNNKQEVIQFPINNECARINQFKHDYSGSLAENYIGSSQNDLIFVQGMSGLNSEIKIPGLYNFGNKSNVAIAKATLAFNLADNQPKELANAKQLFLLDLEKGGIETLTLDFIYSKGRSGGRYNMSTGQYVFDITQHIQKVLDNAKKGVDVNFGLRLHSQVPALNGNDTSNNVLLGLENIEFKLYQTDLNN